MALAMAEPQLSAEQEEVSCEMCERVDWDNESWSKWTGSGPEGRSYPVCDRCFSSPRSFWKDLFSLLKKSGVGTVHHPKNEHFIVGELEDLSISYQHPEESTRLEQYEKLKDPFRHSPLDHNQIRLLTVLPGKGDILCITENININSATARYEALSYCWGDDDQRKHTIWIDGHPFEVFSNLYAALIQLRRPELARKIWIDAICINQVGADGKAEKNNQIPLMGRIYHQAAGVVVWLGPAEEEYDSDKTLDIIAHQNVEAMLTRKFVKDFSRLLKRPWFQRTWIVQEFVLGKTLPQIMCGSRTISFGKFLATQWAMPLLMDSFPSMYIMELKKIVDPNGGSMTFEKKTRVWPNHIEARNRVTALTFMRNMVLDIDCRLLTKPLNRILPFVKGFDVTDHRDKIYGVLGMVSPIVHQIVQVDYTKTIAEVYRDAMTYVLREEKTDTSPFDIYLNYPLSLTFESKTPDLPSWVPDFSQDRPFLRDYPRITWYWLNHMGIRRDLTEIRNENGSKAMHRSKLNEQLIFVNDARLTVSGLLVDEVDEVIESRFFDVDHNMRDYAEQQMNSPSESSQNEGKLIKSWLDDHDKMLDETVSEVAFQDIQWSLFFASTLIQRYWIDSLYEVNQLLHKKYRTSRYGISSDKWLTFIWRDLLEGHPTLTNMSEDEFDEQFYDLTQSKKAISGETWLEEFNNDLQSSGGCRKLPLINLPIVQLFEPPRTFFTTRTSEFYGIGPPGVQAGDKLAFLFPQTYMAFILRPSGKCFLMVGPCIVPPRLRDNALENLRFPFFGDRKFVII